MIGSLLAIGDTIQVNLNFVEQVTAITGFGDILTGVTATRTLTRRFYWSADGTTWSAALTQAGLQALSFDPDDALYLRVEYERTGTDISGLIALHWLDFSFTYDASAFFGRNQIAEENVYEDIESILQQIIEQITPLYDDRPHFEFMWGPGTKCKPDSTRPAVFAHNMTLLDTPYSTDYYNRTVQVRVGIRRSCTPNHKYFDRMRGLIKQRFGERAQQFTYNITLRGAPFLNVKLANLAIFAVRSFGDSEFETPEGGDRNTGNGSAPCGCTWWETTVEFRFQVGQQFQLIV